MQIYRRSGNSQPAELVYTLTGERYLNLAEKMERVWVEEIERLRPTEIYLLLGPRSGFTDSRMVYLWVQSWSLLVGGVFYVHAAQVALRLEDYTGVELDEYLGPITHRDNQQLVYTRAPRIG